MAVLFGGTGNFYAFPMRQNAPRDAQLADGKIAYAILLARLSSAALPSGVRGWGSRSPLADFVLSGDTAKLFDRGDFLRNEKLLLFCLTHQLFVCEVSGMGQNIQRER